MTIKNAKIISTQTDPKAYHADQEVARGDKAYVMSRSDLMEFNHCPHRWLKGYKKKQTEALSYGQMLDSYVLDRLRFNESFIIQPETYTNDKGEIKKWNNNSNTCKAWNAETLKSGKAIIAEKDYKILFEAEKALLEDEIIKEFLNCSHFQVMITAEWQDIPLKCLIDIVPGSHSKYKHYLGDLKTCRTACIGQWPREVFNYGYHVQGAFYLDMYEAATNKTRNGFVNIIQESYEPFETGRRLLDEEFIELGREKYINALNKYSECLKSGKFGGYDDYSNMSFDGFSSVGLEPWMIDKQE